jgi:hypothetical protein
VNVAESHVLRLQAAERVERILNASPDEGLPGAHPGAGHAEMAKEELVASRLPLKSLVELVELPSEGFTQILIVASHRGLSRIREDCYGNIGKLNELWLSAEVNGVLASGSAKDV